MNKQGILIMYGAGTGIEARETLERASGQGAAELPPKRTSTVHTNIMASVRTRSDLERAVSLASNPRDVKEELLDYERHGG